LVQALVETTVAAVAVALLQWVGLQFKPLIQLVQELLQALAVFQDMVDLLHTVERKHLLVEDLEVVVVVVQELLLLAVIHQVQRQFLVRSKVLLVVMV
jgi:hypothetical protein